MENNPPAPPAPLLCSGIGQHHSNSPTLIDGRTNESPAAGQAYEGISLRDISRFVKNPHSCPKENAPWFIPSEYREADARSSAVQRQNGKFRVLCFDVDKGNHSLDEVEETFKKFVSGRFGLAIYSTRSATAENKKWRVLVPLKKALAGDEYEAVLWALNDALESRTSFRLDRAMERLNQLVYLPNKGEFYESHIAGEATLEAPPDAVQGAIDKYRARQAKTTKALSDYTAKPLVQADGKMSLHTAFNLQNDLEAELSAYGCEQRGTRWLAPTSDSGTPGINIIESVCGPWDMAYCHHESEEALFGRLVDPSEVRIQRMIRDGQAKNANHAIAILADTTEAITEHGELLGKSVKDYNAAMAATDAATTNAQTTPVFQMAFATGEEETAVTNYLIDPWVPASTVVGVYGRGEAGKSSFISTLCAQASANGINTLWISSEEHEADIAVRYTKSDGWTNTLVPMTHMPVLVDGETRVSFDVYQHLEAAIVQASSMAQQGWSLGIVVLDAVVTLTGFQKGENANDDKSVKRLIAHLLNLAHEYKVTVFILGHLNKNATGQFREDMVTGSAAWTNSVRHAYVIRKDRDADSDYESIVESVKANTGTHFAARFQTVPVHIKHAREEGADEVLCKTEFVGEVVWGQQAIEALVHENREQEIEGRKVSKQEKRRVIVDFVVNAIRQQGLGDRAALLKAAADADVPLGPENFTRWLDEALKERGINVKRLAHGKFEYR